MTDAVYVVSPRKTKSLERAGRVVSYMQEHSGGPVSVQDVSEACGSFYEETLHVLTTLEYLGYVQRYSRNGAPREGPRVAYLWQPSAQENAAARAAYKNADIFPRAV